MKPTHRAKGWAVLVWAVLTASFGPAWAADIDCRRYLKAPEAYPMDKAQIMQLQEVMDAEGIAHGGDDGVMGPQTSAALKLYCLDATEVVSYQLSAQDLAALKSQLIPADTIALLQPLQDKQYASIALFNNAVEEHFKTAGQKADLYQGPARALIQQAAQKRHPPDESDTFQWNGAKCGCVQDLDRVVYGFYPYWMAGDGGPAIEFSTLSRIAYFAVLMDPTGRLQEHALWKKEQGRADFVKQAHRHRTRVDLVICHPHWPTWYQTVKAHPWTMIETVTGLVTTAPMCDGVTLYFKIYPDDDTYSRALATFLGKLHDALKDAGPDVYLNLMLPAVTKANEDTARKFLTILFSGQNNEPAAMFDWVDLMIVFIEEPTTDAKKQMRYIIEKSFKGEHRKAVLRKIVPILNPPAHFKDKSKNRQFEDDLIYFEDNFGGAGFWPLPTGADETLKAITAQINNAFLTTDGRDFFQQFIYGRTQWFCNFICPHRVPVRWMLAAGLVFLLCWTVGAAWICEWRGWYRKLFWYVMGLIGITAVLLIVLMACDPDLMRRSTEIFIFLLIVLIGSAIYRQIRKMKQAEYP